MATAEYGVVEKGFVRKRYVNFLADMRARARANFGEEVNTSTNYPLGKFLDIFAWKFDEIFGNLEDVYNAISIDTATGLQLDKIVKYKGLVRLAQRKATVTVQVTGAEGTVVPIGFIVAKEDGTTYSNANEATIGSSGIVNVNYVCDYYGTRGNADAGDITIMQTPVTGITAVSNDRDVTNGRSNETDEQLRLRYYQIVGGLSTVEAIRSTVFQVEGVIDDIVIENVTMDTDASGRPPKSITTYVFGGNDNDIADAILASKAAGIQAYGTTVINAMDENGYTHEIGFIRVEEVDIEIHINLTVYRSYTAANDDLIKRAIIEYIGGEWSDGTQYSGMSIAESVVFSRLEAYSWVAPNVKDTAMTIGVKGSAQGTVNIPIGEFQIARCMYADIYIDKVVADA